MNCEPNVFEGPTFSIVIPLFNKRDTVGRAIQSVLNQTVQDFEIVVVDDGSVDNGRRVVESFFDQRIRIIQQENRGVSAARNRGITEAKNEYIAFLDADDEWLPEFLLTIRGLVAKHSKCGLYGTRYFYRKPDGTRHPAVVRGLKENFVGVLEDYFRVASRSDPPIWSSAVCIKKSLLLEIGGFPLGVTSGEDLLTWAKISEYTPFAYSMTCCSIYYPSIPDSYPTLPCRIPSDLDTVGTDLNLLLNRIGKGNSLRHYCSLWHTMRASSYLSLGMKSKARHEICLALRTSFRFKFIAYWLLSVLPTKLARKALE